MQGPLVASVDAVRWAIADRIRDLGGNEQVVDDVAIAAAYAMWCMPGCTSRKLGLADDGLGGSFSQFAYD